MLRRIFTHKGFTLVEVLVVVAIISILAGAVAAYALQSSQVSRDAKRQADLRILQAAIEQYKLDVGRYPEGCRAAGEWSGEPGTDFACTNANETYIKALAPKYIPVLPRDPRLGDCPDGECGFAYTTNAAGTVYKLVVMSTVESETVDYFHPFKSCDVRPTGVDNTYSNSDITIVGMCGRLRNGGGTFNPYQAPLHTVASPHPCSYTNPVFQRTYGVWGGIAPLRETPDVKGTGNCIDPFATSTPLQRFVSCSTRTPNNPTASARALLRVDAVQDTTAIICR